MTVNPALFPTRPPSWYRNANRGNRYHMPRENYIRSGLGLCGANIGRAGFVARGLEEIERAGQKPCRHCVKLAPWVETYAGIYHAACDRCPKKGNGWFWIKGSHDAGTLCPSCYKKQCQGGPLSTPGGSLLLEGEEADG